MREHIIGKIEEIRQKPEHVRIWYVWAFVGIVMLFVLAIWIFTLKENLGKSVPSESMDTFQEKLPLGKPADQNEGSIESLFQTPRTTGENSEGMKK